MKFKDIKVDKAYVITLPHNQERLESALAQLGTIGVSATPFPGVFAKRLSIQHSDTKFTPGMAGCYLSHYMIFREAVANGWESFMVFEDDLEVVPGFDSLFSTAYKTLPDDWEFMWLGYTIHDHVDKSKIVHHSPYWITSPSHWGTQGYVVRGKEAIAKILAGLETMVDQIDLQLVQKTLPEQGIRQYSIFPSAIRQTGVGTDVQTAGTRNNQNKKIQELWN